MNKHKASERASERQKVNERERQRETSDERERKRESNPVRERNAGGDAGVSNYFVMLLARYGNEKKTNE